MIDKENGGLKRILNHTLSVGLIMTMNATEEQFRQHRYDVVLGDTGELKNFPNEEIHFVDGGHFALESHYKEIAKLMKEFLKKNVK